ncbi:MAG: YkgJ family cysteine cluster protein [Candidatus Peribacteraceae bacterium]|nr:YkgJ family cysteine cluster protein [Candidatus Peribacteraceae bacterium]
MSEFKCIRCGLCCTLFNPYTTVGKCPNLDESGDIAICKIYSTRPKVCKDYPKVWCEREIRLLKSNPDRTNRRIAK